LDHTFEAYCLRALKRYSEAVEEQLISMQLVTVDEPLDHYNLACYYALVGNASAAGAQLKLTIEGGGERFKTYAKNDADFTAVRDQREITEILGPPEAINPTSAPDKTAPGLPVSNA
jgi:hypothetical protein